MFNQQVDVFYFEPDDGRMGCEEAYIIVYDGDRGYFADISEETLDAFKHKLFIEKVLYSAVESDFSNFIMKRINDSITVRGMNSLVHLEPGSTVSAGMGNIGTYVGSAVINLEPRSSSNDLSI